MRKLFSGFFIIVGLGCIGRAVYALFVPVPLEFVGLATFGIGLTGFIGIFCIIAGCIIWSTTNLTLLFTLFALVVGVTAAGATEESSVVLMPEHGSLWQLAVACGQPGAAWPAIAAKNPWLKVKIVRGRPIVLLQAGQPVVLPEGWSVKAAADNSAAGDEESVNLTLIRALWADACDMAKDYPVPFLLMVFVIIATATVKSAVRSRRQRRDEMKEDVFPPRQCRDWRSTVLSPR